MCSEARPTNPYFPIFTLVRFIYLTETEYIMYQIKSKIKKKH